MRLQAHMRRRAARREEAEKREREGMASKAGFGGGGADFFEYEKVMAEISKVAEYSEARERELVIQHMERIRAERKAREAQGGKGSRRSSPAGGGPAPFSTTTPTSHPCASLAGR